MLSAVSITVLLGEEGIINKAQESRLDYRYAQISDKVKLRETSLEVSFAKNQPGELSNAFINRLRDEKLILSTDFYDETARTLRLGLQKNGEYKYNIPILDGSLFGKEIVDAINELPDADAPGNEAMKNMTLLVTIKNTNTVEDRTARMFINNVEGLSINWDAKNSNTFETLTEMNPEHVYSAAGEYEVQIKGQAQEGTIFGVPSIYMREEWEWEEWLEVYTKNTKISGIKYWGENEFSEINKMSGRIIGNIPQPSRNSFIKVVRFYKVFEPFYVPSVHKLPFKDNNNYILGKFSRLLSNGNELYDEDLGSITGNIPSKMFANCPRLIEIVELFSLSIYRRKTY